MKTVSKYVFSVSLVNLKSKFAIIRYLGTISVVELTPLVVISVYIYILLEMLDEKALEVLSDIFP